MNTIQSVPDFSKDPRRLKKAEQVLALCYELDLAPTGCKAIKAATLRKTFGNQSNTNSTFSAYMHSLVRQVGVYSKINGETYAYQTVPHRVERLEKLIAQEGGLRMYAEANGKSFATCPSRDEYKLTSDRHYNWWTTIRKEVRQKLFVETHGVLYDYDIEAAKPTVTLQAWRAWMEINHPGALKSSNACKLPTWSQLVYNRKAFRKQLAEEVGISEDHAKSVCQNVLNSAFAAPHRDNPICQLIGTDATRDLMENALYKGLRDDFKTMWKYFSELAEPGQSAGEFMSAMYNKQEHAIMDAVAEAIKVDAWYVHDGFMTYERIDEIFLAEHVLQKTGLVVKFEMKILGGTEGIIFAEDDTGNTDGHMVPYNDVHKSGAQNVHKSLSTKNSVAAAITSVKTSSVVHKLNKRRWSQQFNAENDF